jgi:hypothetical protein
MNTASYASYLEAVTGVICIVIDAIEAAVLNDEASTSKSEKLRGSSNRDANMQISNWPLPVRALHSVPFTTPPETMCECCSSQRTFLISTCFYLMRTI